MEFTGAKLEKSNRAVAGLLQLSLGLVMASVMGCGQQGNIMVSSSDQVLSNSEPSPGSDSAGAPAPISLPTKFKSMTKIVDVQNGSKVDILIVVDNSKSMATEQKNMAERFNTFVDELKGLDWQLGITTTDVSSDTEMKDGRLIKFDSMNSISVLDSTMDQQAVKLAFAKAIQREESGSPYEQGVKATYRAIERSQSPLEVNAGNRQLIREGASLAVIVVTDADETPYEGKDGKPYFGEKNKSQSLINFVNATFKGQKTMAFHSIVVKSDDKECLAKDGNEDYGLHYIQLSQMTNGLVGSVCEQDYGSQLKDIGQKVQQLVKSVRLDCSPVDADHDGVLDVVVQNSNSSPVSMAHMSSLDLVFDEGLPVGQNKIEYQCLDN